MGSIRPFNVKRTAEELAEKFPNVFNEEFNNNKKKMMKMLPDISKRSINELSGYLTRYIVRKKEKAKRELEENSVEA